MREFENWLLRRCPGPDVRWQKACPDPPDFWFWQDDCKYAIEVTSILHEKDWKWTASQWKLIERAENEARAPGTLRGTYEVLFQSTPEGPEQHDPQQPEEDQPHRPPEPWATRREQNELVARIVDYVGRTKSDRNADPEDLRVRDRVICNIRKLASEGADIHPGDGGIDIGGWEDDTRRDVARMLKHVLKKKAKIPSKMDLPTILVLHDRYRLANQATIRGCLHGLAEIKPFHTVYVVQDKGVGFEITTLFPGPPTGTTGPAGG